MTKVNLVIPGTPATKKNSQRIVLLRNGKRLIKPSAVFEKYQESAAAYILGAKRKRIGVPVNVKCVYYMPTHRHVDLLNLLEATCDILVHYGVLVDDNSEIVCSHDGSRVRYDRENPRAEIEISEVDKT